MRNEPDGVVPCQREARAKSKQGDDGAFGGDEEGAGDDGEVEPPVGLQGVEAGAGAFLKGVHGTFGLAEGDEADGGGEPEALEVVGEIGDFGGTQGTIADPGEVALADVPKLGPATQPAEAAGEFA